jgi:hypothetical protein
MIVKLQGDLGAAHAPFLGNDHMGFALAAAVEKLGQFSELAIQLLLDLGR